MKKLLSRLKLSRQTLRQLTVRESSQVAGGAPSHLVCPDPPILPPPSERLCFITRD